MTWQKFRRIDTYVSKNDPIISVSSDRFNFNSLFVRTAKITIQQKVLLQVDPESFRVGFKFGLTEDEDALALRAMTKGKTEAGMSCAAGGISRQFPWIAKAGQFSNRKDRQFRPKKDSDLWVIQLCPTFEFRTARSDAEIPTEAEGLYRYLNARGEVVYIGQGKIKQRLSSQQRKDWDFSTVEYSIVATLNDRERWEAYWITKFKEEHGGKLPYFNLLAGTTSDGQQ